MVSDVNNNPPWLGSDYLSAVEEIRDKSQHLQAPALIYNRWTRQGSLRADRGPMCGSAIHNAGKETAIKGGERSPHGDNVWKLESSDDDTCCASESQVELKVRVLSL